MAEKQPTSVYRYYDKNDLLLYVGITSRGTVRNVEHNVTKDWWRHVARQEVEHHPTRRAAEVREIDLIRKYHPPFNTVHNPFHAEVRDAYLATGGNLSQMLPKALAESYPSRRIDMHARPTGPTSVLLVSNAADDGVVKLLNLQSKQKIILATGKRKGEIHVVTRGSDGVLRIRISCRDARRCTGATLMFRLPNMASELLSIKQIELEFAAVSA